MITSIDSNVIVGFWNANDAINMEARNALEAVYSRGSLVICGAVFGELLAGPTRTEDFINTFLKDSEIAVDWSSSEAVWRQAGAAFQKYAARRRRQNAAQPRRILTDFYIGAHAVVNRYDLLTLDASIYRASFPMLTIVGV